MQTTTYLKQTSLPADPQQLWNWHTRPGAFERLAPPWQSMTIEHPGSGLSEGSEVRLLLKKAGLPLRWLARHREVQPPHSFVDVQARGPFRHWEHRHEFLANPEGGSLLRDEIRYALPFGSIGHLIAGRSTAADIERTFIYRHRTTVDDLRLHSRYRDRPKMRVAISGAGGLMGSALSALLTTGGHEVVRLVREPSTSQTAALWDTERGALELEKLEGLDAVMHLAGENIAGGRWTTERMRRIRASRIEGTRSLLESFDRLERPPKVVLCASAIGIYGDRGDEILDEASSPGRGFLADVGRAWEDAALAGSFPARRVQARFGVVLSPQGGALAKMLRPFKLGAGGRLGDGDQYMSWISIDDAVSVLLTALFDERLTGQVNVAAPHPVSNSEFTRTLGRVLSRPTLAHVPRRLARLTFGRMADEVLLSSARVHPGKLLEVGYEFRHDRLEVALRHLLGLAEETR